MPESLKFLSIIFGLKVYFVYLFDKYSKMRTKYEYKGFYKVNV